MLKLTWIVAGFIAFAMVEVPLSAQALESRADADRRQECRSTAAIIETGAPLSGEAARATLRQIRHCDVSGGPAIARAWGTPSLRAEALELLVFVSWEIHDRRIMDAAIDLARDEGATEELRFGALSVLAAYLDPHHQPGPRTWYESPDQRWPSISGGSSHVFWRPGTQPIDAAAQARIVETLREIEAESADVRVQRVAQSLRIRYDLRHPRQDG